MVVRSTRQRRGFPLPLPLLVLAEEGNTRKDAVRLGRALAAARSQREMRQADVAHRIGVSSQTVSNWECGRQRPDIVWWPAIRRILGIQPNEFLRETATREPDDSLGEILLARLDQLQAVVDQLQTVVSDLQARLVCLEGSLS